MGRRHGHNGRLTHPFLFCMLILTLFVVDGKSSRGVVSYDGLSSAVGNLTSIPRLGPQNRASLPSSLVEIGTPPKESIVADLAVVCTIDGNVSGVDTESSEEIWSLSFGGSLVNSFNSVRTVKTGAVVPGDDGMLYIYTKGNNLEQYELSIPELVELSPMIQTLNGGHRLLVAGERSTRLFSVNPRTGDYFVISAKGHGTEKDSEEEHTDFDFEKPMEFKEKPIDDSPRLIIGRIDYRVRAFDEVTHEEVWNFTYGEFEMLGLDKEISNVYKFMDHSMQKKLSIPAENDMKRERITYNKLPISALYGIDMSSQNFMELATTGSASDNATIFNYQQNNYSHSLTTATDVFNVPEGELLIHVLAFNHSDTKRRQIFASQNVIGKDLYFHLEQNEKMLNFPSLIDSLDAEEIDPEADEITKPVFPYDDPTLDEDVCPADMTGPYVVNTSSSRSKPKQEADAVSNVSYVPSFWNPITLLIGFILFCWRIYHFQRSRIMNNSNIQPLETGATNSRSTAENVEEYLDGRTVKVNSLQIKLDEIKGRGGNGTVVFKGSLENRQVAVKRILLLSTSDEREASENKENSGNLGSISREIEILIKSDGHPNVVRYFKKELTYNFVYLALELCQMSLDQAMAEQTRSLTLISSFLTSSNESSSLCSTDETEMHDRRFLYQIADAVSHLHDLRIVHRDIKPQNVLVVPKNSNTNADLLKMLNDFNSIVNCVVQETDNQTIFALSEIICNKFLLSYSQNHLEVLFASLNSFGALWTPKLSDMGLSKIVESQDGRTGKNLMLGGVHSTLSTNLSFTNTFQSIRATSSVAGGRMPNPTAPGTQGWRAPELLLRRDCKAGKSVDIFSLGNLFFYYLTNGGHPFGDVFERERNILDGNPECLDTLLSCRSQLDHSLVTKMISFSPQKRLRIKEVTESIAMWKSAKVLGFLSFVSDRLKANDDYTIYLRDLFKTMGQVELGFPVWVLHLDDIFKTDLRSSFHGYDFRSVADLLRFIRNKKSHVLELQDTSVDDNPLVTNQRQFLDLFSTAFPRLIYYCYDFVLKNFAHEKGFERFIGKSVARLNHARSLKNEKLFFKNERNCRVQSYMVPTEAWIAEPNFLSAEELNCCVGPEDEDFIVNISRRRSPKREGNSTPSKISLCKHFERTGGTWCPKGKGCGFAHSPVEMKGNDVFQFDLP